MAISVNKYGRKEVGFFDGVMIFLLAIVANLAMQIIISVVAVAGRSFSGNSNFEQGSYFQLISMILLQAAFILVPVIYYSRRKANPQLLAPIDKPSLGILPSFMLPVLSIIGFYLLAAYFEKFLLHIGYNPSGDVNLGTAGKMTLGIFVMVIAAPVCEEIIFRGFLLSGLKKAFNPYIAALLCAIAFSLMHMNPEQTVYQFFLGYACALAAIKSGNLLAAIITHAGSNLIAILIGYTPVGKGFEKFVNAVTGTTAGGILATIGFALVCGTAIFFICYAMKKLRKNNSAPDSKNKTVESETDGETETKQTACGEKNRTAGIAIYIAGLGLCVLMWVFVFVSAII